MILFILKGYEIQWNEEVQALYWANTYRAGLEKDYNISKYIQVVQQLDEGNEWGWGWGEGRKGDMFLKVNLYSI